MNVPLPSRLAVPALAAALLLVLLAARPAAAQEPKDNDAFYLAFGTSNIEVQNGDDLISGSNVSGGVRLGLFWTVFGELGYGTVGYTDRVLIGGVSKDVDFRTTGPHLGLGFIIPVRKVQLGFKVQRSTNNRWSEEIVDVGSGTTDSNISGDIDFDSYYVFTRMGERGWFEAGVRRDKIDSTTSVLRNSFGVVIAFNIPLG